MRKQCVNCSAAQAVRPGGLCNKCFTANGGRAMAPGERLEQVRLELLEPIQSRITTELETAQRYAELYKAGVDLGPGRAVKDSEGRYYLYDGIHRKQAWGLAFDEDPSKQAMPIVVIDGTRRDAVLLSCGVNDAHGKPRTSEDMRRVIGICLNDPEWSQWSLQAIAEVCRVSKTLAHTCRQLHQQGKPLIKKGPTAEECEEIAELAERGKEQERRSLSASGRDSVRAPSKPSTPPPVEEDDVDEWADEADEAPAPKPAPRKVVPEQEVILDGKGDPVPAALAGFFGDPSPGELADAIGAINLDGLIRNLEGKSKAFPHLRVSILQKCWQAITAELAEMAATVESGRPYAACPACRGGRCSECRGVGYVPRWRYDELVEQLQLGGGDEAV